MSDESDQAELILITRFLRFPHEKFLDELHSSTESCDTSASSAAFFEVRNVVGSAEVKFSTSETKPTSSFIFLSCPNKPLNLVYIRHNPLKMEGPFSEVSRQRMITCLGNRCKNFD